MYNNTIGILVNILSTQSIFHKDTASLWASDLYAYHFALFMFQVLKSLFLELFDGHLEIFIYLKVNIYYD